MSKLIIDAKEAVEDIRAGLDDGALMSRYRLSAQGLQSLFKKLVAAGAMTRFECETRIGEPTVALDLASFPYPAEPPASENDRELKFGRNDPTTGTAEEALGEITHSDDFIKGMLDSSTLVSVVMSDLQQNIRFWNKGAENIFGYKAYEMIGKKITKIYPPDALTKETVEQLRAMVNSKTGTVHGKMKQIAKDGRLLTMSLALSPMLDSVGEVQGIVGIGLDVTEEVRQQQEILRLLHQVRSTQEAAIFALARLAESRDEETGSHLLRIQEYCKAMCQGLSERESYRDVVTAQFVEDLFRSSVLHDIGKVSIPDSVLLSPGAFTPEQRKIMENHPIAGGKALEEAVERLGEKSFLTVGMEVAYYHHERWDGKGYPFGLKGEAIPLSARIVAVADVYDALTSKRRYKRVFSHQEACSIILEERGRQFDPVMVDVFEELQSDFWSIKNTLSS